MALDRCVRGMTGSNTLAYSETQVEHLRRTRHAHIHATITTTQVCLESYDDVCTASSSCRLILVQSGRTGPLRLSSFSGTSCFHH